MMKVNDFKRYINIFRIKILDIEFSINIGNPLWFIREYKNIKEK